MFQRISRAFAFLLAILSGASISSAQGPLTFDVEFL